MKMNRVLSGLVDGAGAGLVAGIAAGLLLSIMEVKDRQGDLTWAITLASGPARADKLLAGWLFQLVCGTALGVLFGLLFAAFRLRREGAALWALGVGIAWWMVCWFVLMPPGLRHAPWTEISDPSQTQVAVAGVVAAIGYAAILAVVFAWLEQRWDERVIARSRA
jgi:hypothetical protein